MKMGHVSKYWIQKATENITKQFIKYRLLKTSLVERDWHSETSSNQNTKNYDRIFHQANDKTDSISPFV